MLESQFAQLEAPGENEALIVDITQSAEAVTENCLNMIQWQKTRS
jgi:gluconate kinase